MFMDEFAYARYINDAKKADELHAIIKNIAIEEGWTKGISDDLISPSKLHTYAMMKGIITREERNLLRQFYQK